MAVGICPGTGFYIYLSTHKPDSRTSFVCFNQCSFRFLVIDWLAREFAQRSEFDQQRTGFSRIADLAACLACFEI